MKLVHLPLPLTVLCSQKLGENNTKIVMQIDLGSANANDSWLWKADFSS